MKINEYCDLTYCTNIHSGENWIDHFDQLKKFLPDIKREVSPTDLMAVGLRLSNKAASQLQSNTQQDIFKNWLTEQGLYVATMNGFPYGSFHHTTVKDKVHLPDWTSIDRLKYTFTLASLLAQWLPEGMEGSISTSPGTYRHWYSDIHIIKLAVARKMWQMVLYLNEIFNKTGKVIHIDPEPEPDGLMETGMEFFNFYIDYLLPEAARRQGTKGEELVRRHIRLCLDVCHFAVEYENIDDTFSLFCKEEIPIGKIQISSALKVILPDIIDERNIIHEKLKKFAEPIYLHQVVQLNTDGTLRRYKDLPLALKNIHDPMAKEWRIHYHVPVFAESYGQFYSTQHVIEDTLDACRKFNYTGQLEVETYTWDVLPPENKPDIKDCIVKELQWVVERLQKLEV